jgi:hypothetical protein
MKPQTKEQRKPTYPDDHPFAIFEGNYKAVIEWTPLTGVQQMALKRITDAEEREEFILAARKATAKATARIRKPRELDLKGELPKLKSLTSLIAPRKPKTKTYKGI